MATQPASFRWKELLVAALAVTSHIIAFNLWSRAIPFLSATQSLGHILRFVPAVIGTIVASSLFALTAMFVRPRWLAYGAALAGMAIPFISSTAATTVAVGVLLASALFIASAVQRIRKDTFLSVGFSLSKALRSGLGPYFTVVSLILSLFYLGTINQRNAIASILPRPAFNVTFKRLAEPFTGATGLSGVDPNSTVDEFLTQLVAGQLQEKGIDLSRVPTAELERLRRVQRREIADRYGIELEGTQKVGDVFYRTATQRLEDFLGPYKRYLPFISVTAFFLAVKALTFPLYYLVLVVSALLIRLLRSARILHAEKETIEVERLML